MKLESRHTDVTDCLVLCPSKAAQSRRRHRSGIGRGSALASQGRIKRNRVKVAGTEVALSSWIAATQSNTKVCNIHFLEGS